ncbi:hypothetical protein ABW21_db0206907 [Orbilia brochopaga]|nr:hypothetical protein ABW21_db0206907 [Drechslerella brochopaga]
MSISDTATARQSPHAEAAFDPPSKPYSSTNNRPLSSAHESRAINIIVPSNIFYTDFRVQCASPDEIWSADPDPSHWKVFWGAAPKDVWRPNLRLTTGQLIPKPLPDKPLKEECYTTEIVDRCIFWYGCFCTCDMLQPNPAPGTTIRKYQNALNGIPEAIRKLHPGWRWEVIPGRASMSWQTEFISPPVVNDGLDLEYSNHRELIAGNKEAYTVEGRSRGETWDWLRSPLLGISGGLDGFSGLSGFSKRSMRSTKSDNAQDNGLPVHTEPKHRQDPRDERVRVAMSSQTQYKKKLQQEIEVHEEMPISNVHPQHRAQAVREAFTSYLSMRAQFELQQPQRNQPTLVAKCTVPSDQCRSDSTRHTMPDEARGQAGNSPSGLDAFHRCLGNYEENHTQVLYSYCRVLEKLFWALSILRNQILETMDPYDESPAESTWNWLLEAVEMLQAISPEHIDLFHSGLYTKTAESRDNFIPGNPPSTYHLG